MADWFEAIEGSFKKVFGTANSRRIKRMRPLIDHIAGLEPAMQARSDDELKAFTPLFREQIEAGAPLDDLLPEAFALVREVGVRTLGMRHYDVQMVGGKVLHDGMVAEMKTGEGKTLVATLPVYLNALSGKGAHVVTVNDYLASRDADWMKPVYNFLGLSVGKILSGERNDQVKRHAYGCDVTYGTNNEFGFDYLRDNMKYKLEDYTQRGHHFGIVDEVDSILIDEARTPLIISGPTNHDTQLYVFVDTVIPLLQNELDFVVDEKGRSVTLSDDGIHKLEQKLGVDNLYDPNNMVVLHHVNQALKAHYLFKRDKDYMVQSGKVVIVDEHTGRLMHGRRWSDGLHQAVEAKEKLNVEQESQTYASITFQNYFRMYDKLSGMTGTAETEAAEFANIYNLDCVVIPTNEPIRRDDDHDIVYRTQEEKFRFVLADIVEAHERGQPVLVGTTSVEKSEIVSRMLQRKEIPHHVLNAKQHASESRVVAQAGQIGAITISTNMAGRGTDIKLGGNPEELAKDAVPDWQENAEAYKAEVARLRPECEAARVKVLEAGGLRIVGTERHESRRIDNQLRGRAGRQGDPGSSKFYMSLEDDLLRIFGSDKILAFMEKWGIEDDEPIESRVISKSIENAQKKVEGHNFQIRKNLLEYDDVLNQQRQYVYDLRRKALAGEGIRELTLEAVEGVVDDIMDDCAPEGMHPEDWTIGLLRERITKVFGVSWEDETDDELRDHAQRELRGRLLGEAMDLYTAKEEAITTENARQIERMLLLQFTDQLWRDHLLAMDRLRDGIGLRGYGQRNPLLEYKKEGYNMFMMMNALRDEHVVSRFLRVELTQEAEQAAQRPSKRMARAISAGALEQRPEAAGAPARQPAEQPLLTPPRPQPKPAKLPARGAEAKAYAVRVGLGRNDPCPCGSEAKYKKCCAKTVEAAASPA